MLLLPVIGNNTPKAKLRSKESYVIPRYDHSMDIFDMFVANSKVNKNMENMQLMKNNPPTRSLILRPANHLPTCQSTNHQLTNPHAPIY